MVHGRDLLPGYENCNFLFLPDLYKATFSHGKKKRPFFSFPRRKDVILKLERRDDRQWENKVRAILLSVVFFLL